MITPKEIEKKTMSEEKRKSAKNDYFAFYIGRPISYILTIPFLYTDISPNTISVISIIPIIIGFIFFSIAQSKVLLISGWICFFIWNLLDGVDGNVARYKGKFSKIGSVYDAMSGYLAMVLTFFAVGIAASNNLGIIGKSINLPSNIYLILGGLSGISVIFPRLVMHKSISTLNDNERVNRVKDKSKYSFLKLVALNLTSIAGFVQVFILIAIIFNIIDLFTICYFFINLIIMIVSLQNILTERK